MIIKLIWVESMKWRQFLRILIQTHLTVVITFQAYPATKAYGLSKKSCILLKLAPDNGFIRISVFTDSFVRILPHLQICWVTPVKQMYSQSLHLTNFEVTLYLRKFILIQNLQIFPNYSTSVGIFACDKWKPQKQKFIFFPGIFWKIMCDSGPSKLSKHDFLLIIMIVMFSLVPSALRGSPYLIIQIFKSYYVVTSLIINKYTLALIQIMTLRWFGKFLYALPHVCLDTVTLSV